MEIAGTLRVTVFSNESLEIRLSRLHELIT
jgi:hypothetical protein